MLIDVRNTAADPISWVCHIAILDNWIIGFGGLDTWEIGSLEAWEPGGLGSLGTWDPGDPGEAGMSKPTAADLRGQTSPRALARVIIKEPRYLGT